jgi:hypothetical protein
MGEPRRYWSDEDCGAAAKIYAGLREPTIEGACKIIGVEINRSYWGVRTRFLKYGPEFCGPRRDAVAHHSMSRPVDKPIVIPAWVLAERDRRRSLEHTSLSALLFGDPLPGCSALDRSCG